MTAVQKKQLVAKKITHYRSTVRWWLNHRHQFQRFPQDLVVKTHYCPALGIATPGRVCATGTKLIRAKEIYNRLQALTALPAHNALWECLRPYEGSDPANQDTGNNGHWGGLQMHPDWGRGTSHHASDDPWIVQKKAAELGYETSGFSSSWLWGQWGQTLGHCVQYA